ncbi:MAG: toprim domain-containing protein [Proteobacteria bacterium]|nr:toprim domain-containing protein [Pseudomonadota bacterium]
MSRDRDDVVMIKDQLVARLPALLDVLVPGARPHGAYWKAPNPTRAEKSNTSFTVWRSGAWKEFDAGDSEKGDVLGLIAYVHRSDFTDAINWARDWLGLGKLTREDRARMAAAARDKAAERQRDADRKAQWKREKAFKLWMDAAAIAAGDPADLYLKGRGIDLGAIASLVPGEGRFAARCEHWKGETRITAPAMIWPVRVAGAVTAIHATFLEQVNGRWGKLTRAEPRLMLGAVKGGFVMIAHGPSGLDPGAARRAGRRDPLVAGEGIETMASLAMGIDDARVWAALNLGNLAALPWQHPCISQGFVALENDIKPAALAGRDKVLAEVTAKLGQPPGLLVPPSGNDFNDTIN